ncbi:MAG TPA: hypothetical protein VNP04_25335 [Alphaproteobacteria bacterium]|nr:hypothetical protein [Alphaproteobacteria bacterium]
MKELMIRQKLDDADDELVQLATKTVDETGIAARRNNREIMQDKQLRNVIAVADDTKSVAVVENFIKYQIGRHDEWRYHDFGEKLIGDLRRLREWARKMVESDIEENDLAIRLVRRYLGYLMRYFVYQQKVS